MFRSLAAHTTTKLTPNDQLTILPNSVRRKTTPTMMSGSDPSPVMMATASMMPESRLSSSRRNGGADAERASHVNGGDDDAPDDNGLGSPHAWVFHVACVSGGDYLESQEIEEDDGEVRKSVHIEPRRANVAGAISLARNPNVPRTVDIPSPPRQQGYSDFEDCGRLVHDPNGVRGAGEADEDDDPDKSELYGQTGNETQLYTCHGSGVCGDRARPSWRSTGGS